MSFGQWLSLFWRKFTPLEEQLIASARTALSTRAQVIFDEQVAAINLVRRHPNHTGIYFYRKKRGKVDWSDVRLFPRYSEIRLVEVRFSAGGRRYKATLTSIQGHIFDFAITPGPKKISFEQWNNGAEVRLTADPMSVAEKMPEPEIPENWQDGLANLRGKFGSRWTLHDASSAYRLTMDEGEFVVLAELEGDRFLLHRVEPTSTKLFFMESHDDSPRVLDCDPSTFLSSAD